MNLKLQNPPTLPVLIYDGDCTFCIFWVEHIRIKTGERVEYIPFQNADILRRYPELSPDELAKSLHFLETDGQISIGAEAVFSVRYHIAQRGVWLWLYRHLPGARFVCEAVYRTVVRNREQLYKLIKLFF